MVVSKLVWRKHLASRNNFPRRRPPAFIIDPARIGADVLVMTQTILRKKTVILKVVYFYSCTCAACPKT